MKTIRSIVITAMALLVGGSLVWMAPEQTDAKAADLVQQGAPTGSNTLIVRDFIGCWETKDSDCLMSLVADDIYHDNIPWEPQNGKEEFAIIVQEFLEMTTSSVWDIHFIAEDADGVVLTERTDYVTIGDQTINTPIMGIFEIENGKIAKWRDYFDGRKFDAQMATITGN